MRWLGTNASLLCSFYFGWILQHAPYPTVLDLVYQIYVLKILKKHGTSTSYNRPEKRNCDLSVLVFADDSSHNDYKQLFYLSGLLSSNLESGSTFHTLSSGSHESQSPVEFVTSAERLSALESIDGGKVLVRSFKNIYVLY